MKVLVLDNYDSFTYNLVEYLRKLGVENIDVYRNREIDIEAVDAYDKILLSPGPGIPSEAGILKELIRKYAPTKSIFGVCLGQQAMAEVFGGEIENLSEVYHGISSTMYRKADDNGVLKGMAPEFLAGRYHSWNVSNNNFPDCFEITCVDENDRIMGIRHREYDLEGVQFHPESVLTPEGLSMLKNWIED